MCGRPPEDFEITARRYIQRPELVFPRFKVGSKLDAVRLMLKTMLTRAPDLDRWEAERGIPCWRGRCWLTTAKSGALRPSGGDLG